MIPCSNLIGNHNYFKSIEETAMYLNCASNRAIHPEGKTSVSIVIEGSSSMRFTLAVTIAFSFHFKRHLRWKYVERLVWIVLCERLCSSVSLLWFFN